MDNYDIRLTLGGEIYDYVYNSKTRTVCTQLFPDVPVFRVFMGCGHSIGHDTLLELIEKQRRELELLAQSFS